MNPHWAVHQNHRMESEIEKFAKDVSGVFKATTRLVLALADEKSTDSDAESKWLLPVVLFVLLAVGLVKGSEIIQNPKFVSVLFELDSVQRTNFNTM